MGASHSTKELRSGRVWCRLRDRLGVPKANGGRKRPCCLLQQKERTSERSRGLPEARSCTAGKISGSSFSIHLMQRTCCACLGVTFAVFDYDVWLADWLVGLASIRGTGWFVLSKSFRFLCSIHHFIWLFQAHRTLPSRLAPADTKKTTFLPAGHIPPTLCSRAESAFRFPRATSSLCVSGWRTLVMVSHHFMSFHRSI